MPDSVRDEIAAHLSFHPARSVTLPWGTAEGHPVTVALLVTTAEGHALNRNQFNRAAWTPALKQAGVDATRENGCHALATSSPPSCWTRARTSRRSATTWATPTPDSRGGPTHIWPQSAERTKRAVDDTLGRYIGATSQML